MEEKYTAQDIQTLSGNEHVRMRPQLYFQKCFHEQSLASLPLEMACHALDEYFDGKCTRLDITIMEDYFTVKYDAGISLDMSYGVYVAQNIMTKIGVCSNHKKHLEVGAEFCELGIATINFASEICRVITVSNGQKGCFNFAKGITESIEVEASDEDEHTLIMLKPDRTIFGDLKVTLEEVQEKVNELSAKVPGLEITVKSSDATVVE